MPGPNHRVLLANGGPIRDEVGHLLRRARHWYRADTYTLSGANVATLPNRGTAGGAMVMKAGTLAAPLDSSTFGYQKALAFGGSQWLDSSLLASEFKFLHDGTGFEAFVVFAQVSGASRTIAATKGSGTSSGVQIGHTSSSFGLYVYNTSALIYAPAGTAGVFAQGALHNSAYHAAIEPKSFVGWDGSIVAIGVNPQTPSTFDPSFTFRIGANCDNTAPFSGDLADLIIFKGRLTPYERQLMRDYTSRRYGIAMLSPYGYERDVLRLNPYCWLRADRYILASGKVNAWIDLALPGHKPYVNSAANQCATPLQSANWNGAETAVFTGQQTYRSNLPKEVWTRLHDGTGATVYAPFRTSSGGVLFATHAIGPGPGMQLSWDSGDRLRLYIPFATTSSKYAAGAAPLNTSLMCRLSYLEGRTPSEVQFRTARGSYAGNSDQAPTLTAPEDTLTWASNPATAGSNANFGGEMPELLIFDHALTTAEQDAVEHYFLSRYNVGAV